MMTFPKKNGKKNHQPDYLWTISGLRDCHLMARTLGPSVFWIVLESLNEYSIWRCTENWGTPKSSKSWMTMTQYWNQWGRLGMPYPRLPVVNALFQAWQPTGRTASYTFIPEWHLHFQPTKAIANYHALEHAKTTEKNNSNTWELLLLNFCPKNLDAFDGIPTATWLVNQVSTLRAFASGRWVSVRTTTYDNRGQNCCYKSVMTFIEGKTALCINVIYIYI